MCVYSNSFIDFLNHAGNGEPSDNAMINTPEAKCCSAAQFQGGRGRTGVSYLARDMCTEPIANGYTQGCVIPPFLLTMWGR